MTRPFGQIPSDEIEESFDRCPHCGRYIVRCTDAHYCEPTEYRPNPNEQECRRRIEDNPFPDDDTVLVLEQPSSKAYAYHEPESDDKPLCSSSTDQAFVSHTCNEAHEHGRPPCQRCQRIRQTRETDQ